MVNWAAQLLDIETQLATHSEIDWNSFHDNLLTAFHPSRNIYLHKYSIANRDSQWNEKLVQFKILRSIRFLTKLNVQLSATQASTRAFLKRKRPQSTPKCQTGVRYSQILISRVQVTFLFICLLFCCLCKFGSAINTAHCWVLLECGLLMTNSFCFTNTRRTWLLNIPIPSLGWTIHHQYADNDVNENLLWMKHQQRV